MEYMESMMQSRYEAFEDMLEEYLIELDATVCNCMAAGVSANQIVVTLPELNSTFDHNVCVTTYIGFNENRS